MKGLYGIAAISQSAIQTKIRIYLVVRAILLYNYTTLQVKVENFQAFKSLAGIVVLYFYYFIHLLLFINLLLLIIIYPLLLSSTLLLSLLLIIIIINYYYPVTEIEIEETLNKFLL